MTLVNPFNVEIFDSRAEGVILDDDGTTFSIDAVSASKSEGDSGTDGFEFNITRRGNVADVATVDYSVAGTGGNPADWADFGIPTIGTAFFAKDETSVTVSIPVRGDLFIEPNETFDVNLSNPYNPRTGFATIDRQSASGTIIDDDANTLSIHPLSAVRDEGDSGATSFTFQIVRSGNGGGDVTVNWGASAAGAIPADGSDFEGGAMPSGKVQFVAGGATAQTITMKVQGDDDPEPRLESFKVVISASANAKLGTKEAYGTIVDDDITWISMGHPVVRSEGDSGSTPFQFTVIRTGDVASPLTLSYSVLPGPDPAATDDGLTASGTLTFAAGANQATITVGVTGDTAKEPNEHFTVMLTDPATIGRIFNSRSAVGTIVNDDIPLPPWPRPVTRGDPHLVTLDGLAYDFQAVGEFVLMQTVGNSDVAVQIRTAAVGDLASNISALAALIEGHRVTITAGESPTLRIDGVQTTVPETIGFIEVGAGTVAYDGSAYTLIDPDGAGIYVQPVADRLDLTLSVGAAYAGTLQGLLGNFDGDTANDLALADGSVLAQPMTFADLYGAYAAAWRVTDATSLFDYGPGESTATFADPAFPKQLVALDMLPDTVVAWATALADEAGITEPALREAAILDLALTADLSYLLGGTIPVPVNAVAKIVDGPVPLPILSVVGPDGAHWEGDASTSSMRFDVFRTANLAGALSVHYEVAPFCQHPADADDFGGKLPSGILDFAEAEGMKSIDVLIAGDTLAEHSEAFTVRLSVADVDKDSVLFAMPNAMGTIENDDGEPLGFVTVRPLKPPASEGNQGTAKFEYELLRADGTGGSAMIDYRVQGDGALPADAEDFAGAALPAGTIAFLPGEARKIITVPVLGDTVPEADEAFLLVLSNPRGVTLDNLSAIGVIADDDAFSIVRLGDAPARQSGTGGQWAAAWTSPLVAVAHKADHSSAAEAWTPVSFNGVSPQTLPGGDVYQGDLGVSGQSVATSSVRQEIDGREALRFDLDHEARAATVNLARFHVNDDGGVLVEAGLLRLIDSDGKVVAEQAFRADSASGMKQVKVTSAEHFVALELLAGAYDGEQFVFGAYANANGSFGAPITTDPSGAKHGSDFLLDWIEFELPLLGVPADPGP